MPLTIAEKILARHAGLEAVEAGQLVICDLDLVMANDVTGPPAIKEFEKIGRPVFNAEKIALIPDHFQPAKDIKSADLAQIMRSFARKNNITHYYEQGRVGIEHVILPEFGIVAPGMLIIGADSHTCTYGALNAFATGVGTTDLAVGLATGKAWFKVPESINVHLTGKKPKNICGKDIILTLIGNIGVDGALYKALEFTGEAVAQLSMTDRLTISNMAIEAGAKAALFPFDKVAQLYVARRVKKPFEHFNPDKDANYCSTVEINLSELKPVVALPHLPDNVKPVDQLGDIKINQVVIGSCTNGRLEDLGIAAGILRGRKVHDDVRCIIIPGSQEIYKEAIRCHWIDIFIDAGCVVSCPTCGPCLGGYMGILSAGERCVSTTNRNFRGRMGHVDSEVYLASPFIAAASAVLGKIATPEEVIGYEN